MIKIDKNIDVWITSDTHYGHKNLCRGTTDWRLEDGSIPTDQTRDFTTIEMMNQSIVYNINSVVKKDDILIHLGDWSFGGFENIKKFHDSLICKNIHLILGNHDHHIERNKEGVKELFLSVSHYETLVVDGFTFRLMHYPISSWDGLSKGYAHLHGHCHLPPDHRFGVGRRMDVGLDGNPDFKPYNIRTEIIPLVFGREVKSDIIRDHHVDNLKGVVG
jgi:calcineurin-like phosphoesterase family protein